MIHNVLTNEKGTSLLETLVALGIMGAIAVAFLSGLATATRASTLNDERCTAESLARSQLEYVKDCAYQGSFTEYPVSANITVPDNWTVLPSDVVSIDTGIQKVTVIVQHNGNTVMVIDGYKVDR